MKVDKLALGRIFDQTERLEAPLFQRPYVWDEEKNWKPLWESLVPLAEGRFAFQTPRHHFLGAIVMDQLPTITGKIHKRQIIDGQQRLTTLQICLAAARDLADMLGLKRHALAFRKLTDNDSPLSEDSHEVFKVWPTNADRETFRKVMSAGSKASVQNIRENQPEQDGLIAAAYLYFETVFQEWVGSKESSDCQARMDALYNAIREDLHVVIIDLEKDDDAQVIFETLNALGTPLLPADLVKNYLFRKAEIQQEPTQQLYDQHWAIFDSERKYWRKDMSRGRLNRPRLDWFLQDYLTLMRAEEINAALLFTMFKGFVESVNQASAANTWKCLDATPIRIVQWKNWTQNLAKVSLFTVLSN